MSRPRDLGRFLSPQSIAVIGASDRPGSLGFRTMQNLAQFAGRIHPVNPRLETLAGHRCHARVADLPEAPDCAVLAVPAAAVEDEVRACARRGAAGCVVFASGYAELGTADGRAAQDRLAAIAREAGMRLLGPNTTGFANFALGAHAGFAEFPGGTEPGRAAIGLVSQSGALGLALAQSAMHGTAISHVLTCGNSADVDVADLVRFLAAQPEPAAIALCFEGIADPAALVDAVRDATRGGTPVAVFRVGCSPDGAAAAAWHTGTAPHRDFPWDAALSAAGAVVLRTSEALIEVATFLAKTTGFAPPATAPRGAILSSSGGSAIFAADCAAAAGVPLADLGSATTTALAAELPAFASPRNPCDATAQATAQPAMLLRCAEILLADPAVDALVLPWGKAWNSGQFENLSRLSDARSKPICLVWMSQWLEGPGAAEVEASRRLSLFRSMGSCMSALAAWTA